MKRQSLLTACFVMLSPLSFMALAQLEVQAETGVKVTPATYVRAESDRSFGNIAKQAGGVNRWFKIRLPNHWISRPKCE